MADVKKDNVTSNLTLGQVINDIPELASWKASAFVSSLAGQIFTLKGYGAFEFRYGVFQMSDNNMTLKTFVEKQILEPLNVCLRMLMHVHVMYSITRKETLI